MSQIEPPAKALKVIRSIVVPAELLHAAQRANLHLMDLTDFSKLRTIASLEDIATFAALNDNLTVGISRISTNNLSEVVSLGGGNAAEYNAVFGRMATYEETIKLALSDIEPVSDSFAELLATQLNDGTARVVTDKSMKNVLGGPMVPVEDSTYQLKTSGSNVFVVVGSGFSKYVGAQCGKECCDEFIRCFLKLCSGLYSPAEVARHPLFKTFLHSLAA